MVLEKLYTEDVMALFNLFKRKKKEEATIASKVDAVETKSTEPKAKSKENESLPEKVKLETPKKTVEPAVSKPKMTQETKSTTAPKTAALKETKPVTALKAEKSTSKTEEKTAAKVEVKAQLSNETSEDSVADERKYTGRFEINKSKDGKKFFFNLYASNKVGIATSQMYSSAQSAINGVKSVIANAAKAPIEDQSLKKYDILPFPKWEIYIDNGGKYRFRLNASNGNCVCHSQGYTTKTACKNGIDSIIRSSKNAEIDKTYIIK